MKTRKPILKCAGILLLLSLSLPAVQACGRDDYTGSICLTAATYCPEGTMEAAGQMLKVSEHQTLYALLKLTYGGDGKTFALPNLQGRVPVGINPAEAGSRMPALNTQKVKPGEVIGSTDVILSVAQLPAHTHALVPAAGSSAASSSTVQVKLQASSDPGEDSAPSTAKPYLAAINASDSSGQSTPTATAWSSKLTNPVDVGGLSATISGTGSGAGGATIASTGGGQPVSTQSPAVGMRYCIVTGGEYPVRPQ